MVTIKWKDKEIELKKLNYNQLIKHVDFLRDEVANEYKRQMFGIQQLPILKLIWETMRSEVKEIDIGTDGYKQACFTLRGLAYALVLIVSETDKAFKLEDAINMIDETVLHDIIFTVLDFKGVK